MAGEFGFTVVSGGTVVTGGGPGGTVVVGGGPAVVAGGVGAPEPIKRDYQTKWNTCPDLLKKENFFF